MPENRREQKLHRKEVFITRRTSTIEKFSVYVSCRDEEHAQEIVETVVGTVGWDAFRNSNLSNQESSEAVTDITYEYDVRDLRNILIQNDKFNPNVG